MKWCCSSRLCTCGAKNQGDRKGYRLICRAMCCCWPRPSPATLTPTSSKCVWSMSRVGTGADMFGCHTECVECALHTCCSPVCCSASNTAVPCPANPFLLFFCAQAAWVAMPDVSAPVCQSDCSCVLPIIIHQVSPCLLLAPTQVVSSAIVDKYIGESARVIREMFGYAREHQVRLCTHLHQYCGYECTHGASCRPL